jgi:hypothetical protein
MKKKCKDQFPINQTFKDAILKKSINNLKKD